jgi:hypothetical protein
MNHQFPINDFNSLPLSDLFLLMSPFITHSNITFQQQKAALKFDQTRC